MNFYNILLEQYHLMESLATTIRDNPSIPEDIIRHYHSTALPNDNKRDNILAHVLKMHKTGAITPETSHLLKPHLTALSNTNQLHQLKNLNTLEDHQNATKGVLDRAISKRERVDKNTPLIFENDDITIHQHLNHESAIKGAKLHPENPMYNKTREPGKAQWCVSVDDANGKEYYNEYTNNGEHPFYTITNKKTKSKTALVASPHTLPLHKILPDDDSTEEIELRGEKDNMLSDTPEKIYKVLMQNPGLEHSVVGKYLKEKSPESFEMMNVLPHSTTKEQLHSILEHGSRDQKILALHHPNINKSHLTQALHNHGTTLTALQSDLITPEHISSVLAKTSPSYKKERVAAMMHPNADTKNIDTGLEHTDPNVRAKAAGHPNATYDQISKGMKDSDTWVVSSALGNANAHPNHIGKGLESNNPTLRYMAATSRNITPNQLDLALGDDDTTVRGAAIHNSRTSKEQLENLAKHETDSHLLKLINHKLKLL